MKEVSSSKLIIYVAAFILLFGNITFFSNVLDVYPFSIKNSLFLLSLAVVFGGVTIFLLSLLCYKKTVKPVLIIVLLVSSSAAYFMDSYNIIIDDLMIDNIVNTDAGESLDLLSLRQILYLIFLGIVPSIFIYKSNIVYGSYKASFMSKAKILGLSVVVVVSTILVFGDFYASFFREHKTLRFYANPAYYMYSAVKYSDKFVASVALPLKAIAMDAKIPPSNVDRELIILVVGETARADHFSLNGYDKKTNPYLEKKNVTSFTNFWACGTSTAVSVPCMFSIHDRSSYNKSEADSTENVLDILQRAGVNVLWLDNNSDSKGVAVRVPYESYKSSDINPICDIECRDVGMLEKLQTYVADHPVGDIFIVLHQMGNHGPAYYKRYPKEFEKFTPTCQTNQLEKCTSEEISNTYDNAILYTDFFLSEVIGFLEKNDDNFESAMLYMSDHGESLGENNLYLHGLPYFIAPDAQKHVPVIMWFGENFVNEINIESLKGNIHNEYSHDNLFSTLLGIMEVETSLYDTTMDLIEHDDDD